MVVVCPAAGRLDNSRSSATEGVFQGNFHHLQMLRSHTETNLNFLLPLNSRNGIFNVRIGVQGYASYINF